jgi:hypothetical protein
VTTFSILTFFTMDVSNVQDVHVVVDVLLHTNHNNKLKVPWENSYLWCF